MQINYGKLLKSTSCTPGWVTWGGNTCRRWEHFPGTCGAAGTSVGASRLE